MDRMEMMPFLPISVGSDSMNIVPSISDLVNGKRSSGEFEFTDQMTDLLVVALDRGNIGRNTGGNPSVSSSFIKLDEANNCETRQLEEE